ncbi:glycogen debranching enzyme [Fonsecaea pedrosoi]|nr:glycogen debranching enzyme [Fonsecaea pedrosoi]
MLAFSILVLAFWLQSCWAQNSCPAVTQHLTDPPYDNYFYSDCNSDSQAVVTSPLPDSNLSIIGPRLIIAWPAGNSGICTFFQPQNGPNGSLAIELVNSTVGSPLGPVYRTTQGSANPFVGVQGIISFNTSATLTIPILGSIRTIRDFTEGPSLLRPIIQDAINITRSNGTGATLSRLWLDNVTTTTFTMVPYENPSSNITINQRNKTISFGAGFYWFSASFNYPQLTQLPPSRVLNTASQNLITEQPDQTTSLSFLSYTEKLLAGAWRFLTYFGRDSMISTLLLEPVLSQGNGSATEAVIGAVLERLNRTDGSVCHEETIGDYATYLNLQDNVTSTAPGFTYPMIDTDYYLPVLMAQYFNSSPSRISPFLSRRAGTVDIQNRNLTYQDLVLINAEKIINITAAFAQNQTSTNLIHLKSDQIVGQWRDSTYGLGGGRIPFDVNTALVPAALRAIGQLARTPGVFPNNSNVNTTSWRTLADSRAQIWEENTLQFFETNITASTARSRLEDFVDTATFYNGPTNASSLPSSGNVTTYSIALDGYNNLSSVNVQHSDSSFRVFFVNASSSTPEAEAQETRFINATANSLLRPFPAGLMTPQSMIVANPALSGSDVLIANFTNAAYHGCVVWSFQLSMMAKGLERQLARCNATNSTASSSAASRPAWCGISSVYNNVVRAYNALWDSIDANAAQLQGEVWSWTFNNRTGDFVTTPLGVLPPPPGVGAGTESDIRQLWSLTFLAVRRNEDLR